MDSSLGAPVCILYWGVRGGGSTFTVRLIETLKEQSPSTTILTSIRAVNHDRQLIEMLADRIELVGIFDPPKKRVRFIGLLRGYVEHARRVRSFAPRVIVVTMNSPLCVPVVVLLRIASARVVYVVHDATPHPGDYYPLLQKLAHRILMACAQDVVALSGFVRNRLLAAKVAEPAAIRLLPLEVVEPVRPDPHPAMPPKGPLALLFVGRLLPYKGLELLRDALEPLRRRADWRLTVAGDGPWAEWVSRAFLDWPQVTLKLGWLAEHRFDELIDTHHLLLCPYTEASQSGVVARAMARGLPAVATPVGALPDQVGPLSRCLVAGAVSPSAFAAAITTFLDDPAQIGRLSAESLILSRRRRKAAGWADLVA